MKSIRIQINFLSEKELYQNLGNIMAAQKLLNDYLSDANNNGIGPEGYAEDWLDNFGLTGPIKDKVLKIFFNALLLIGRHERGIDRKRI